jgi:cephalosporin hydroxylase
MHMTVKDDRVEFELEKAKSIENMAKDSHLLKASNDLILESDKHRYSYLWSWMGAPIIQRPADIVALQEIIWTTQPDVIIETGVARGGSMVFLASMLQLIGKASGIVIGVDIDIRAHNRDTIERHPMAPMIRLVEGSSIAAETIEVVKSFVPKGAKVMVILDSDHSRNHVFAELRAYAPLVTKGQFLVAADTILGYFTPEQAPTYYSKLLVKGDEPLAAVDAFLKENDEFERDPINGKLIMSSSPGGFLRKTK